MVSIESALLRLSAYIERQLPILNAPGIVIGITGCEQILHVSGFGLANTAAGQPVTPDSLFQIGSISKSFTSIALLQLQEQGLLDINDPVTKYLPWFEIQSEYEPITLHHLMSHTAGIITGSDETISAYTEAWNLRYTKATAPPGEMFHYSNSGYKVLGLVLQTLLGQSMADILRECILTPLGMDATLPVIRSDARSRLAVGYSPFFDDRPYLPVVCWRQLPGWNRIRPMARSARPLEICVSIFKLLLQHGNGLLTPNSFEQLIAPVIPTGDDIHGEHYGLGLSIQHINEHRVICHSGGMVGYTANMLADLDAELGVIVLTNGPAEPENISRYILKLVHAAWEGDELPELPLEIPEMVEQADDYAGQYHSDNKSFRLTSKNRRLYMGFEAATVLMEPHGPDRFFVPHPAFELFPLQMGRENGQITEAVYGGERFVRSPYRGQTSFEYPIE